MAEPQLTPFEHILIGLVCLSPASGYDLKRIFAATPMGIYQPSSGSLYPALRRLETKGLVKAAEGAGESARHRRVYEPTQAGRAAHAVWLRTPVEVSTVSRDLGLHLMRFVMMEHAFSREEVLSFLDHLKDALAAFTAGLERHAAAIAQLDERHPGLALDHGLAVHRASLRWTRHAVDALRAAPLLGPRVAPPRWSRLLTGAAAARACLSDTATALERSWGIIGFVGADLDRNMSGPRGGFAY